VCFAYYMAFNQLHRDLRNDWNIKLLILLFTETIEYYVVLDCVLYNCSLDDDHISCASNQTKTQFNIRWWLYLMCNKSNQNLIVGWSMISKFSYSCSNLVISLACSNIRVFGKCSRIKVLDLPQLTAQNWALKPTTTRSYHLL
jgi:hypothetical protein